MRLADRMGHLSQPRMNRVQTYALDILIKLDDAAAAQDAVRQFKFARAAIAPEEIPDLFGKKTGSKTDAERAKAMEDGTIEDSEVPWTIPSSDAEREELEDLLSSVHNFTPTEGGEQEWQ